MQSKKVYLDSYKLYRMNLTENLLTLEGMLHWSQHLCLPMSGFAGCYSFCSHVENSFWMYWREICANCFSEHDFSQVKRILGDFCAAKIYVKEKH